MDITKLYVDMCEKSSEIQGLWKPEMGDWFHAECTDWQIGQAGFAYEGKVNEVPRVMYDGKPIPYLTAELSAEGWLHEKLIWLPRQDQLQGMIKWDSIFIIKRGDTYFRRSCGTNYEQGKSLEQVWLAFVMKEKYNKTWKDETWDQLK